MDRWTGTDLRSICARLTGLFGPSHPMDRTLFPTGRGGVSIIDDVRREECGKGLSIVPFSQCKYGAGVHNNARHQQN